MFILNYNKKNLLYKINQKKILVVFLKLMMKKKLVLFQGIKSLIQMKTLFNYFE